MEWNENIARELITAWKNKDENYYVIHGVQTIYGTGTAQKIYLRVSEYFQKQQQATKKSPDKHDLYTHVGQQHIVKEKYPQVSNYWLSIKSQYIKELRNPTGSGPAAPVKAEDAEKAAFWKRFDEASRKKGATYDVSNNKKGLERAAEGTTAFKPASVDALIDDLVVRRSCKFLLYDSIEQGRSIAYALDDLDLKRLANREIVEETQGQSKARKLPICTTELREVFRRWRYFAHHVTFYSKFKVCDPPWLSVGTEQWASYARKLAEKRTKGQGDGWAKLEEQFKAKNFVTTINLYHQMPIEQAASVVHATQADRE